MVGADPSHQVPRLDGVIPQIDCQTSALGHRSMATRVLKLDTRAHCRRMRTSPKRSRSRSCSVVVGTCGDAAEHNV